MLDMVNERDAAQLLVSRMQQRIGDLFGPDAAELDGIVTSLQAPSGLDRTANHPSIASR